MRINIKIVKNLVLVWISPEIIVILLLYRVSLYRNTNKIIMTSPIPMVCTGMENNIRL